MPRLCNQCFSRPASKRHESDVCTKCWATHYGDDTRELVERRERRLRRLGLQTHGYVNDEFPGGRDGNA